VRSNYNKKHVILLYPKVDSESFSGTKRSSQKKINHLLQSVLIFGRIVHKYFPREPPVLSKTFLCCKEMIGEFLLTRKTNKELTSRFN
jgi:hypothetical protein